jgi:hypothetical protein
MGWRHQRRGRRLNALGGNSYPRKPYHMPKVPRFEPVPVDEAQARQKLGKLIEGLAQGAVDEATGHPLDNLINAMADQWVADVYAQHARYVATLVPLMELTEATTEQTDVVVTHDRSVLSHQVLGLENALLRVVGHDPRDHRNPPERHRWRRLRFGPSRRYETGGGYREDGDYAPHA